MAQPSSKKRQLDDVASPEDVAGDASASLTIRGELPLPKMTCWANWDEWREVKRCLFSADIPKGLKRVHTWRLRQHLPLSIDITASLLQLEQETNLGSDISRLAYAMTLVRMVNGLVDPCQTKLFAMSVSRLAVQLGLPRCLVEVRHDATHKQLPSLPMLKYAAAEGLAWLREHYWEEQEKRIGTGTESILLALHRYRSAMENEEPKRAMAQLKTLVGLDVMAFHTELLPTLANCICSASDNNKNITRSHSLLLNDAHKTWDRAIAFLQTQYVMLLPSLVLVLVQALTRPEVPNSELVRDWVLSFLKEAGEGLDGAAVLQMCLTSMSPECVAVVRALPLPAHTQASVDRLLRIATAPTPIAAGPEIDAMEAIYGVHYSLGEADIPANPMLGWQGEEELLSDSEEEEAEPLPEETQENSSELESARERAHSHFVSALQTKIQIW